MPTFFVIGAAKCGTSSLHEYLDLHPGISMSDAKEPNYFVQPADRRHEPDLKDTYLKLFSEGSTARGESSVRYSMFPMLGGVPAAIRSEVDDPKFIYMVRDPISRAASMVANSKASPSREGRLSSDVSLDQALRSPSDPLQNRFLLSGMYMTQIRQYLNEFPEKSILVIDSEELRTAPHETLSGIFSFLGLPDATVIPDGGIEVNPRSGLREKNQLYLRLARSDSLRQLVHRLPRGRREWLVEKIRKPLSRPLPIEEIRPDLRRQLEAIYRPEVEELRSLTGKAFAHWSI